MSSRRTARHECTQRVCVSPASWGQRRLWFQDQLHAGLRHNVGVRLRLTGAVDTSRLESAVNQLAGRHESLRATLRLEGSELIQVAGNTSHLAFKAVSRSDAACLRDDSLKQLINPRFDLQAGPIAQALLIEWDESQYEFALTVHHALCDRSSLALMLREIAALYKGEERLAEPVQYHEFTRWQQERAQSPEWDDRLRRRVQELAGAPSTTTFPPDRRRLEIQEFSGRLRDFELGSRFAAELSALAKEMRVSPFNVLLAIVAATLVERTSATDVVIAALVDGRSAFSDRPTVGFYSNVVPLRLVVDSAQSFVDYIAVARGALASGLSAHDLPFEEIVAGLALPRDLSKMPLAQVSVAAHHDALLLDLPGTSCEMLGLPPRSAEFDISLDFRLGGNSLGGHVAADAHLYSEKTADEIMQALLSTAKRAVTRPRSQVLPARARLSGTTGSSCAGRRGAVELETIVDRVMANGRARSDDIALLSDDGVTEVTYGELADAVDACAAALIDRGVRRGDVVGIYLPRSVALPTAMLAILRAGAAYLPLDPSHPPRRTAALLEDAGARFVVTAPSVRHRLSRRVTCLEMNPDGHLRYGIRPYAASTLPTHRAAIDDIAYLIYTSGSTGQPKGVIVTHRNLTHFVQAMLDCLGHGPGRWLATTTISFDIAFLELLFPLLRGDLVVIQSSELEAHLSGGSESDRFVASPIQRTLQLIKRYGVTHLQCTPTIAGLLSDIPEAKSVLAGLKHLLIGGEEFPRGLVGRLPSSRAVVWNLYGPTEATIWASLHQVIDTRGDAIPLGVPLSHAKIYVIDEAGAPVPPGELGEIAIGGAAVAAGYWRRPRLTASRFRPDPFGQPGSRLYRTGDRGWLRSDGLLMFSGRSDDQIKIHGLRIELGEVEAALLDAPGVSQAAVTTVGPLEDRQLAAYVVLQASVRENQDGWRDDIREHMGLVLPTYMVPTWILPIARLPLTANGKIDRRKLPEPSEQATPSASTSIRQPTDDVELRVSNCWTQVLARPGVDVDSSFFDVGGDSLRLLRLQLALQDEFNHEISLALLFECQTIRSLASRLRSIT